jgi:2-keto-4-pentenoate hydratase
VADGDLAAAAANQLLTAMNTGVPVPPVRELIGSDDLRAAYTVPKKRLTHARIVSGAEVVGRKIGLTSQAVHAQSGVDQPDLDVLFSDMAYDGGAEVPFDAVLQPRAEAEIAFVRGGDLAEGDLSYDPVREAIAYAATAIQICGSRVQDWDISSGDIVADNASAGAYVLGPRRMAQHVDVGDRLATIGEQHREIDQDPAAVTGMNERRCSAADSAPVSPTRSASSRKPNELACDTTPGPARAHVQPGRPRRTLHPRSASLLGLPEPSQNRSPYRTRTFALSRSQTISGERSGLAQLPRYDRNDSIYLDGTRRN